MYARESDYILPTLAGPEIGVASTKAFLGQILILYILALKLGTLRGDLDKEKLSEKLEDLKELPKLVEQTLLTDKPDYYEPLYQREGCDAGRWHLER